MKIVHVNKSYSWLQWPVTLKSCDAPRLHVTAKFFGSAPINPFAIIDRVPGQFLFVPFVEQISWRPEIFNDIVHVLEFTRFPEFMTGLHDEFAVFADQFPSFRPHITVPKVYWDKVNNEGLSPIDEKLAFGPLELCYGTEDEE
jgi:hypothetical protein